jgi:nitroreductase
MENPASPNFPLADGIRRRWSPRAFGAHLLSRDEIGALFEAARWAPSAMNEQPWRFLVASREDKETFATLLGCLVPGNQVWAKHAAVLSLCFHARAFEHKGRPNPWATHDLGLATENLILQAQSMGLRCHVMAGIDATVIRESYEIPAGYEPLTAIAIGAPGDPESLPEDLKERELAPRTRKPLAEILFEGSWGQAANLPGKKP